MLLFFLDFSPAMPCKLCEYISHGQNSKIFQHYTNFINWKWIRSISHHNVLDETPTCRWSHPIPLLLCEGQAKLVWRPLAWSLVSKSQPNNLSAAQTLIYISHSCFYSPSINIAPPLLLFSSLVQCDEVAWIYTMLHASHSYFEK